LPSYESQAFQSQQNAVAVGFIYDGFAGIPYVPHTRWNMASMYGIPFWPPSLTSAAINWFIAKK